MGKLASGLHDVVVGTASMLGRKRRLRNLPSPVKVNIGSGLVVAPGWVNLDVGIAALIARWPWFVHHLAHRLMPPTSAAGRDMTASEFSNVLTTHSFYHHRIEHGLPFEDSTVDYLYSSHVLEHLYLSDARALLKECRRVLKPGGVLRVCVPDLAHAVRLFNAGSTREALEFFFYDATPSAFTRHRYMYDFDLLAAELGAAGFGEVERRSYREGLVPDLDRLDNREDETLFIEAGAGMFAQEVKLPVNAGSARE